MALPPTTACTAALFRTHNTSDSTHCVSLIQADNSMWLTAIAGQPLSDRPAALSGQPLCILAVLSRQADLSLVDLLNG